MSSKHVIVLFMFAAIVLLACDLSVPFGTSAVQPTSAPIIVVVTSTFPPSTQTPKVVTNTPPPATATNTPTLTPAPTLTSTPMPGAKVSGRVYVSDINLPAQVTVNLTNKSSYNSVKTSTDAGGYYSFSPVGPSSYTIEIEIASIVSSCPNLRMTSIQDWKFGYRISGNSPMIPLVMSEPFTVTVGALLTKDPPLMCR